MIDSVLFGVTPTGEIIELCRWLTGESDFDSAGWLEKFGDRIGSGSARLPDGAWVDLSAFCVVRGADLAV